MDLRGTGRLGPASPGGTPPQCQEQGRDGGGPALTSLLCVLHWPVCSRLQKGLWRGSLGHVTPFRSSDLGPRRVREVREGVCVEVRLDPGVVENLRPLGPGGGGPRCLYPLHPSVQASGSTLCCVTSSPDIVSWGEAPLLSGDPGWDLPQLETQAHAALLSEAQEPGVWVRVWDPPGQRPPGSHRPPPTWGGSCAFNSHPPRPARGWVGGVEGGAAPTGLRALGSGAQEAQPGTR